MSPDLILIFEITLEFLVLVLTIQSYFSSKSKVLFFFIFGAFIALVKDIFILLNKNSIIHLLEIHSAFSSSYSNILVTISFLLGFLYFNKVLITKLNQFKELEKSFDTYQKTSDYINSQYSMAIESAGVGVWDWDISKNIYTWNEQMYSLWELDKKNSMEENIKSLVEKIFPEDYKISQSELQLALENKKEYKAELRFYLKDGSIRYIHAVGKVFRDESGIAKRMIGVNIDVTEGKKREEQFLKSENKWKSLVEAIPDYIAIFDTNGRYLFLNHYAEGFSQKDIEGKSLYEFLPEESKTKMRDAFNKAISSDQIQYIEHSGYGDNLTIRTYNNFIVPIKEENQIESVLVISRDITDLKNYEKSILESERLLQMAYVATDMGVWRHDILKNKFYLDKRSQQHHGFTKDEIEMDELTSIIHPEDLLRSQEAFLNAVGPKGDGKYSEELRIIHPTEGIRWLYIHAFIATEGEGENKRPLFSVGTSRDITDKKNSELELITYRNNLESLIEERTKQVFESLKQIKIINSNLVQKDIKISSINKELEAFSYSVSHDLRSPLRSIDGFSNLILKKYANLLPEEAQDYFFRVRKASQKMATLIDELLRLSKINRTEIKREEVNLSEIVSFISNELINSEPNRKVEFLIQPNIQSLLDKNLIYIALENLLSNAWKYSKDNEITKIEFGCLTENNTNICFIKDNGVGFDMKYATKLFGAFQRLHTSSEFEGTGIGLAIVQRIINRHGGKIWTEAELNKGATFYFTI